MTTTALPAALEANALEQLFLAARTHQGWQPAPVAPQLLQQVYDLAKMAPTASNSQPMRVLFVQSPEAKERLRPTLAAGNVAKTMTAPVTAIVAMDTAFYEYFPRLFPAVPTMRDTTAAKPEADREAMAFQSTMLQAAYLIVAARAVGLDCAPMAGFDKTAVDAEFFVGSTWKACLLINLGYGDQSKLYPRAARLSFDEACRIA